MNTPTTPNTGLRERLIKEFGIDEYGVTSENGHYIVRRVLELITQAERRAELKGRIDELERILRGMQSVNHLMDKRELTERLTQLRTLQENQNGL